MGSTRNQNNHPGFSVEPLHDRQHIVKLHEADVLPGQAQTFFKFRRFLLNGLGQQHFGGGGHQGTAGNAKGQGPFHRGVHVGAGDADLIVIHLHILILEHQQAQSVVVGHGALVEVFTQGIVLKVLHIHVHMHMVYPGADFGCHIDDAAVNLIASPVKVVHIKVA